MILRSLKLLSFTLAFAFCLIRIGLGQSNVHEQRIEVSMRMIGHQILLSADDSTSRVLPIQRENGRYRILFESDFGFNPDDLLITVSGVFAENAISEGYILEVEKCETQEVVYSYQDAEKENFDIIPCRNRNLPKSCYTVLITLIDEHGELLSSSISQHTDSSASLYAWMLLIVAIAGSIYLVLTRKAKSEVDPDLIILGDYMFDKRNTKLTYDEKSMDLTSKEADLLMLLYNAVNTNVEREVILQKVWGDEGDYIGRTVDVFISKLRKKLEFDSTIKIVNIRGVGYKLVLNG